MFTSAVDAATMPAEERMQFADGLFIRGIYDLAIPEYLALLRDAPDYAKIDAALYRLAESYRQVADKTGAERFYKRLIDDYPKSDYRYKAAYRRAELFVAGGQYMDAVSLFKGVIDSKPPSEILAPSYYYLGYSLDKLRIQQEAEQALKTVLNDYPDSPFASYAALTLGEIYQRIGGREDALLKLYEQAAAQPASSRVGAEAIYQCAELAYRQRNFANSAEAYGKLRSLYPDDYRVRESFLHAAWSFYNTGQFADALKLADDTLSDSTGDREEDGLYLKANCERKMGRNADAVKTYERLMTRFPKGRFAPLALYEMALVYHKERRFADVLAQADRLQPGLDIEEDFCWILAESALALTNRAQAAVYYRRIVERYPDSPRASASAYGLARLLQEEGDYEGAVKEFRKMAGRYRENEWAAEALYAAAYCNSRLGRHEESSGDWKKLMAGFPTFGKIEEAYFHKALSDLQAGDDRSAQDSLEELLKKHPDSAYASQAFYWLGVIGEKEGRFDEAESRMRDALARSDGGKKAEIEFRLAALLQKQKKFDEAADILQRLMEGGAKAEFSPPLLEWLVRFQLERKEFASAEKAADELVSATNDPAWKQIGLFLLGRARMGTGNEAGARKAFEQALKQKARTADGAESAFFLAEVQQASGDLESAEKYYQQAAELSQDTELLSFRAKSYYGLGQVAAGRGQWDQSARYYLSVAVLFDDPQLTPECLFRAAEAFGKIGREEDRIKALEELKARYPDSQWNEKK